MKTTWKGLASIIFMILPLAYLGFIWSDLPEQVPTHWNIRGEIDAWSGKSLLWALALMPAFFYLIFLLLPILDPKKNVEKMGEKLNSLKFLLVLFTSVLAIYLLQLSKNANELNPNTMYILIGAFFCLLGNYFKVLKPNYFIGIRTPWTLNNETNWKQTHLFGGKIWFAGGILMMLLGLISSNVLGTILFLSLIALLAILPIGYSYWKFREEQSV